MQTMQIGTDKLSKDDVLALYENVGWIKYTEHPTQLMQAVKNSTFVVTIHDGSTLIGLARSVTDDVSIHYLQDILVHTEYQRQGIGRKLLGICHERFKHVRTHMILTDDEERQKIFYESFGYKNIQDYKKIKLNGFVKFQGLETD